MHKHEQTILNTIINREHIALNRGKAMKFTLKLGLFPHHIKHCRFYTDTVYIKTEYSGFPDKFEERKVKQGKFRYNNHLYSVPPCSGEYGFHDLHIATL